MLIQDAKRRPDAQTLLGHAWIRKSRREKSRNGVTRYIFTPSVTTQNEELLIITPMLYDRVAFLTMLAALNLRGYAYSAVPRETPAVEDTASAESRLQYSEERHIARDPFESGSVSLQSYCFDSF